VQVSWTRSSGEKTDDQSHDDDGKAAHHIEVQVREAVQYEWFLRVRNPVGSRLVDW
jgi:hypothetical protein